MPLSEANQRVAAVSSFLSGAITALAGAVMRELAFLRLPLLAFAALSFLLGAWFSVPLITESRAMAWLRGRAARRQGSPAIDFLEVNLAYAERDAEKARQAREFRVVASRIFRVWNELAELQNLYPPVEKETLAQANAREQLRAVEERRLIEELHTKVVFNREIALRSLDESARPVYQSISDSLNRANSVAELRQPIRELYNLFRKQG